MPTIFPVYRWKPLSTISPVAKYAPSVFRQLRPITVFFMILRECLHERNELVIPITITGINFQSSTIKLAVFLIGVFVSFTCLLSLVSLLHVFYTLKSQRVNWAQDVALGAEAFAMICLMPYSILHSVWLFVFVRQEWTSTFPMPIQVLQFVLIALILLNTVTEGRL